MNANASCQKLFVLFALMFLLSGCAAAQPAAGTPGAPKPNVNIFSKRIVFMGNSMEPSIKEKQTITYEALQLSDVKRGDILIFKKDESTLVRRLIGLPNETVEIREGVVYINDQALEETYLSGKTPESSSKITLASDEYYLMGDNRSNRNDSRSFGPVKAADILGRVVLNP